MLCFKQELQFLVTEITREVREAIAEVVPSTRGWADGSVSPGQTLRSSSSGCKAEQGYGSEETPPFAPICLKSHSLLTMKRKGCVEMRFSEAPGDRVLEAAAFCPAGSAGPVNDPPTLPATLLFLLLAAGTGVKSATPETQEGRDTESWPGIVLLFSCP